MSPRWLNSDMSFRVGYRLHSGRLRRRLQVHCRAGQLPRAKKSPTAPGVLAVLRRSVAPGRNFDCSDVDQAVWDPITDTLCPGPLPVLRVWACDGTPPTLDPQPCSRVAAGGRGIRPGCGGSVPRPHVTPGRPVSAPRSNRSPVRNPRRPTTERPPWHVTWCHSGGTVHPGHPDLPSDQAWQISAISGTNGTP